MGKMKMTSKGFKPKGSNKLKEKKSNRFKKANFILTSGATGFVLGTATGTAMTGRPAASALLFGVPIGIATALSVKSAISDEQKKKKK